MIVYVESNFILELTYQQEEHQSCEKLLAIAQAKKLILTLPAVTVTESRLSLRNRRERRERFRRDLNRELRELLRSKPYQELAQATILVVGALIQSNQTEEAELDSVLSRIFTVCEFIPLGVAAIKAAMQLEATVKLKPKDALVLAAVLQDLPNRPAGPKVFLNRNSNDFANPDIDDLLIEQNCKLFTSFQGGLNYLRGAIVPGNEESSGRTEDSSA